MLRVWGQNGSSIFHLRQLLISDGPDEEDAWLVLLCGDGGGGRRSGRTPQWHPVSIGRAVVMETTRAWGGRYDAVMKPLSSPKVAVMTWFHPAMCIYNCLGSFSVHTYTHMVEFGNCSILFKDDTLTYKKTACMSLYTCWSPKPEGWNAVWPLFYLWGG